jgi:hypothetical protein
MNVVQIILLALLLVIIGTYVHVFTNKKINGYQKMVWAMAIFFIAPFGSILYFVFGSKPKKSGRRTPVIGEDRRQTGGHSPHFPYDSK